MHELRAGALFVDLYELTMLQGYWHSGMRERAVFSLYFRSLPGDWNYVLACGLAPLLEELEDFRFKEEELDWLASDGRFRDDFLRHLADFRFTGEVRALREGTPVFPEEPILEVDAPIPEAQLIETLVMNRIHLQTVLATSASRVVQAAAGRSIVDFAMRRMHGRDAALFGARAFRIAGVEATSNVEAGRRWGIPVTGTMAHSWIQAHETEEDAFRSFTGLYPETVLLVDTYDTAEGVERVIALARELGDDFRVRGIRIDSGDLGKLARAARARLDEAGLDGVQIFASGGLDEFQVGELVEKHAPIDAFGVGTRMGVSTGAPVLDIAYKLTWYGGEGRLKLSPGKRIFPGAKQVFRLSEDGRDTGDILDRAEVIHPGRPLLEPVMSGGERLATGKRSIEEARGYAERQLERLPHAIRHRSKATEAWPVAIGEGLQEALERTEARIEARQEQPPTV